MQAYIRANEARLLETLNDLSDRPEGWTLVHFHLGDLLEEYKSDYQVRIAVNLIHDLLRAFEGGIYALASGAIAVLARDVPAALRNKLIFQLRYLYMDDPLAYGADGSENTAFCSVYALETQLEACIRQFTRAMTSAKRASAASAAEARPPVSTATLFSAERLAHIETDLTRADISHAVRRQAVCAFAASGEARRVFDELYIHIPALRELLRADIDFLSNKWLFKYLTQLLDKRVMQMITVNAARYLAQPLSINVNAQTLLSDEFAAFDAKLPASAKVSVVFEIHAVDVFADTAAFLLACKQVQKLGYRVCLDGLNDAGFLQIRRQVLGVDLIKLQWNVSYSSDLNHRESKPLRDAVAECGANRLILCRCDTAEAVEYGQALGISLFQGRYLDRLLDPKASVTN